MALLDDIGNYLSTQGFGTVGTDIFLGRLPDTPDGAVAIVEYGGLGPVNAMASSAGSLVWEQPRVQVLARGASYTNARTRAESVYRLLHWAGGGNLTSTSPRYGLIQAIQSPFLLTRDANDRPIMACNFQIQKSLSS